MEPFVKVPVPLAAEICARYALKDDARKLLEDGIDPRAFVTALFAGKQYVNAIEFMAYALPVREGVWWGCLCMQHSVGENLAPKDRDAATAAVRWVLQPGEDTRAAAKASGEAVGPASAAGALAIAASQSMMPPGKAITLAVKIASSKAEPVKIPAMQRAYAELAIEVADGRLI